MRIKLSPLYSDDRRTTARILKQKHFPSSCDSTNQLLCTCFVFYPKGTIARPRVGTRSSSWSSSLLQSQRSASCIHDIMYCMCVHVSLDLVYCYKVKLVSHCFHMFWRSNKNFPFLTTCCCCVVDRQVALRSLQQRHIPERQLNHWGQVRGRRYRRDSKDRLTSYSDNTLCLCSDVLVLMTT